MGIRRRGWEPYEIGDKSLEDDWNIVILRVVNESSTKTRQVYEVEHTCCGMVTQRTHQNLQRRINSGHKLCKDCGQWRRSHRDHECEHLKIPLPDWPVPDMLK